MGVAAAVVDHIPLAQMVMSKAVAHPLGMPFSGFNLISQLTWSPCGHVDNFFLLNLIEYAKILERKMHQWTT